MADVGLRHAHAGGGQAIQGVDFGALPGFFLHLAPVARAFFHGARLPAVLGLAAFLIGRALAETALLGVLVDLGAADLVAAADDIDGRFLAAHQLAQHLVDQAFDHQRLESLRVSSFLQAQPLSLSKCTLTFLPLILPADSLRRASLAMPRSTAT